MQTFRNVAQWTHAIHFYQAFNCMYSPTAETIIIFFFVSDFQHTYWHISNFFHCRGFRWNCYFCSIDKSGKFQWNRLAWPCLHRVRAAIFILNNFSIFIIVAVVTIILVIGTRIGTLANVRLVTSMISNIGKWLSICLLKCLFGGYAYALLISTEIWRCSTILGDKGNEIAIFYRSMYTQNNVSWPEAHQYANKRTIYNEWMIRGFMRLQIIGLNNKFIHLPIASVFGHIFSMQLPIILIFGFCCISSQECGWVWVFIVT